MIEYLLVVLEVLLGMLLVVVGLCVYVIALIGLYVVTTDSHALGTMWGQFWSTFGQELVTCFVLLGWATILYGWFWIWGVPLDWPIYSFFALTFLPVVVPWVLAKLITVKGMFSVMSSRLFRIGYLLVVLWFSFQYIGIPTFLPASTVGAYYGEFKNPNKLLLCVIETISTINDYRSFRKELNGVAEYKVLAKALVHGVKVMDYWHSRREAWGAERKLTKRDYADDAAKIWVWLASIGDEFDSNIAIRLKTRRVVITRMDHWWHDLPTYSEPQFAK